MFLVNPQASPHTQATPEGDGLPLSELTDAIGACTGFDPGPDPSYDEEPIPDYFDIHAGE